MLEWQDKLAEWQDWDVTAPFKAYENTVGAIPAVESGVLGVGGYFAGRKGSEMAASYMLEKLLAGKSPQERAVAMEKLRRDGSLDRIRTVGGILGGGAGALFPILTKGDFKQKGGLMKSLFTPNYWKDKDNAKVLADTSMANAKKRADKEVDWNSRVANNPTMQEEAGVADWRDSYASEMCWEDVLDKKQVQNKEASWGGSFQHPNIPVSDAVDYFKKDDYLQPWQRQAGAHLVQQANGGKQSGLVSGDDLMRAASGAGVGYLAGQAFGKTMGALFDLPKPFTEELSNKGGYAMAIANTGIFRSLIK